MVKTLVKTLVNTGQTLVKHWSNTGRSQSVREVHGEAPVQRLTSV
jgi:hypothetical protein